MNLLLVTVRCPHCGRLLDLRLGFEAYCPLLR